MPTFNTKPLRYNPAGEAKSREQKRQAEFETEEKNKKIPVFMFQGFGFRPQYGVRRGTLRLDGPLCPKVANSEDELCFSELTGEIGQTKVICDVCNFSADLPKQYEKFKEIAHKKYLGNKRFTESGGNIQTLDVPFNAIKAKDEDETRTIKIKWAQKDGRNMAIIYFIQKDKNGKKSQIFADIDREEIRYDSSDIPPGKILAQVKAIFPKTKIKITYNHKEKKPK